MSAREIDELEGRLDKAAFALADASLESDALRDHIRKLEAELHARNVEAKSATIQAVGLRKQIADAIDVLSAR